MNRGLLGRMRSTSVAERPAAKFNLASTMEVNTARLACSANLPRILHRGRSVALYECVRNAGAAVRGSKSCGARDTVLFTLTFYNAVSRAVVVLDRFGRIGPNLGGVVRRHSSYYLLSMTEPSASWPLQPSHWVFSLGSLGRSFQSPWALLRMWLWKKALTALKRSVSQLQLMRFGSRFGECTLT
jgi:hypothetical protein